MNWPLTAPEELENAEFEATCPTCKHHHTPKLIEYVPRMLHIPPRYALLCNKCRTPFYVKDESSGD